MIDWLARNLHDWSDAGWLLKNAKDHPKFNSAGINDERIRFTGCGATLITRQQWLDRRAELQGKPSWADAPEWAEWLCQRDSGSWIWCSGKPTLAHDEWYGEFAQATHACEVLGDWRDTLERRPAILGVSACDAAAAVGDVLRGEQPLSRADALRWAVENVKTWPAEVSDSAPSGWTWQQCSGRLYLQRNDNALISKTDWGRGVAPGFEPFTSLEDAPLHTINCRCVVRPVTLHTIHHAAFLHRDCQLLLNEPELVVFRTADGELLHCKPKECLVDPDTYGLAARLLSDMSGCNVAPEHMRELCEQMNWRVEA